MLLYRWARPQKHWGYTAINGSNIASTTYSVYYKIWNTVFFQFSKVNHEKWMHVGMFFEEGRSPFQPGHRQLLHHGFRGSMRYWFSSYIRILITRNHKRHTRVLLEVCRVPTKHLALFCFLIMKQYYITAYHLYKQMNCIRSQRQFSRKEITNFVTCIGILEAIGVLLILGPSTENLSRFQTFKGVFSQHSAYYTGSIPPRPILVGPRRVFPPTQTTRRVSGHFRRVTTELWDDGELERCLFFRLGPKTLSSCAGDGVG